MDIAIHTPLHSSDAVIIAVAKKLEVKGLISLDKDMDRCSLTVYTTDVENDSYDDSVYSIGAD